MRDALLHIYNSLSRIVFAVFSVVLFSYLLFNAYGLIRAAIAGRNNKPSAEEIQADEDEQ